jgi:RecQ-mediated genome instability protein 1
MAMAHTITTIRNELMKQMKAIHYTCTLEWLQACVNWVEETYGADANRPIAFYMEQLKQQWIDTNLKDMESKCLPPKLIDLRLTTLPETYGLQVNSIQDIGESAYSQYSKIKKTENENTTVAATDTTEFIPTWQPKPRRCLYMSLTDGSQTIFGMELESIPALSLNGFRPGCKILIKGPVDCRKGVLHLKPHHVTLLGGEVEDLALTHSVENVLTEILDLENRE